MKLTEELKKQAKSENKIIRQNAKDCLAIANKLMELENGHVWSSQWRVLVSERWVGKGLNCKKQYYEPTEVGRIFLNGIK